MAGQQPLPCPLRAPLGLGRGAPSVPLSHASPSALPPQSLGVGTLVSFTAARGAPSSKVNCRMTGKRGRQGAAVSETLSCRILAQRLLPLLAPAAAHRARSRSGASVTYRCPCATTQGDLPPLPRGPKPW